MIETGEEVPQETRVLVYIETVYGLHANDRNALISDFTVDEK